MEITHLSDAPTPAEVTAYIHGYGEAPWLETHQTEDAKKYLSRFRAAGSAALGVRETPDSEPYLYVNFTSYNDAHELVTDEFAGDEAFYIAKNPEEISAALEDRGTVCFISNIHADKDVAIDPEHKPRLKALPSILDECFAATGADCIALLTHRDTGVYRHTQPEKLPSYRVEEIPYSIEPVQHNDIDELILFVVTPLKKPTTAATKS